MSNSTQDRPRKAFGLYLALDGYGAPPAILADLLGLYQFLDGLPHRLGLTRIMPPHVQEYRPPPGESPEDWGLRGAVLIAESHIAVHTYPDKGTVHLDVFSCKDFDCWAAEAAAKTQFQYQHMERQIIRRGLDFYRGKGEGNV